MTYDEMTEVKNIASLSHEFECRHLAPNFWADVIVWAIRKLKAIVWETIVESSFLLSSSFCN